MAKSGAKFLPILGVMALGLALPLSAAQPADQPPTGDAGAAAPAIQDTSAPRLSVRSPGGGIKTQAEVDAEVAQIMQMLRNEGIDIDERMERARILCRNQSLSDGGEADQAELDETIRKCILVEEEVVYGRAINEMNANRANAFDSAMAQYNADIAEVERKKREFDLKQSEYESEMQRHNAELAEVQRKQEQYRREKAAHDALLAERGLAPQPQIASPQAAPPFKLAKSEPAPRAKTPAPTPAPVESKPIAAPPRAGSQPEGRTAVVQSNLPVRETVTTPAPARIAQNTAPVSAPDTAPDPGPQTRQSPSSGSSTGAARSAGATPTYGKILSKRLGPDAPSEVELAIMEASGPRIALVIGNERYDGGMGELSNPVNDAVLIGTTLRSLGFDVEILRDASQREMKEAVQRLGNRLEEAGDNATGLFYYAGHGVQSKGQNFLIPVGAGIDSESDLELEAVKADAILAQMEEAYVSTRIVILDACRNMPLRRRSRNGSRGLARMETPNGSFVAYSTSPGSTAADGGGINSPFAESLAEQMRVPDRPIEVTFREVRRQVVERTSGDQVPWNSSSLLDTFSFAR